MISLTSHPKSAPLHSVAIIAFDRKTGQVHGTFIHSSFEKNDTAGIARSRERFLADVRKRLEREIELDALEMPHNKLPAGAVERINPKTRAVVSAKLDAKAARTSRAMTSRSIIVP